MNVGYFVNMSVDSGMVVWCWRWMSVWGRFGDLERLAALKVWHVAATTRCLRWVGTSVSLVCCDECALQQWVRLATCDGRKGG